MKIRQLIGRAAGIAALGAGAAAWAVMPRGARRRGMDRAHDVPDVFYAHRGLHDAGSGLTKGYAKTSGEYISMARGMAVKAGYGSADSPFPIAPENSLAAFAAACEAGYGIELDIQLTADGQVVVVHDADLMRVAGDPRRIEDLTYEELTHIPLFPAPAKPGDAKAKMSEPNQESGVSAGKGIDGADAVLGGLIQGELGRSELDSPRFQHVPLFSDVLDVVAGRVPIIVEYKINHADWWTYEEELMAKGDALLEAYNGPYVIESFNPLVLRWYRQHRPEVCRGQLASRGGDFKEQLKKKQLTPWFAGRLLFDFVGRPDFVAYEWHGGDGLPMQTVQRLGAIPTAWTIRSTDELAKSEPNFDRHIFESFLPKAQ